MTTFRPQAFPLFLLSLFVIIPLSNRNFDNLPFRSLYINTVIFQPQPLSLFTIADLVATEGRAVETNDNPELRNARKGRETFIHDDIRSIHVNGDDSDR